MSVIKTTRNSEKDEGVANMPDRDVKTMEGMVLNSGPQITTPDNDPCLRRAGAGI